MRLNHIFDRFALLTPERRSIWVRSCVQFSEFSHVTIKAKLKNVRKPASPVTLGLPLQSRPRPPSQKHESPLQLMVQMIYRCKLLIKKFLEMYSAGPNRQA